MAYPPAAFDLSVSNQPDPPAAPGADLSSLAAQLTPEETSYLTAIPPEAWQSEALWDDPVFQGIASKAQAHLQAPPAPVVAPAPPPDPRIPSGGALDAVKALGLNDPTTWTTGQHPALRPDANVRQGAPSGSMLWNTLTGLASIPASAEGAALGAMTDRPGDLGHAASAAWQDVQRTVGGLPATTMGDQAAPDPTTASAEAIRRGATFPPGAGSVADFLLDPLNVSNPLTDALHLGVAAKGLAGLALAKGSTLVSAASMFPNFIKALGEASEAARGRKAVQAGAEAIKGYHGSPHDLGWFDSSKIGTGEGAAAYGHGTYIAQNPAVAGEYQKLVGGRVFAIGDRDLHPLGSPTQSRAETLAARALDDAVESGATDPAREAAGQLRAGAYLSADDLAHRDEAVRIVGEWQTSGRMTEPEGHLYDVSLHADPERLLDWDTPLSQQSEAVQEAVARAGIAPDNPMLAELRARHGSEYPTGADIHAAAVRMTGSQEAASALLHDAGLHGIQYLDQGSRVGPDLKALKARIADIESVLAHGGDGPQGQALLAEAQEKLRQAETAPKTRNYVVFDDRRLEVTARNGQPVTVLARSPEAVAEIKALFPRLDAYTKKTAPISAATIVKRLAATGNLSPEARTALLHAADRLGDRRVMADELHAMVQGQPYKPDRVLRKVKAVKEGAEQVKGAPLGISTARQEKALREKYLDMLLVGLEGRDWYQDAGQAILAYANGDPERAYRLAEDIAITSSGTSVSANTGFGVKGYNQATAGVPIVTGRFPTAMGKTIAEVHAPGAGGVTGLKRTPFADNLARGGGFIDKDTPARAVHDIWEGEAFGYVNEDGSPLRRGFTPAEHAWMDKQTDLLIKEANERKLGGFDDWDELKVQAAAWIGAKVKAGQMTAEDAARSYAAFFDDLAAQGSREVTPGKTTGHMPELLDSAATAERQQLHDAVISRSGLYDAQGRDQLAAGYGGLVGPSFEGPGLYKGAPSPGMQTRVLTGSEELKTGAKGARALDEGSMRILRAAEATHGILTVQDMSAFSRVLPAGSGAARTGWEVALPGGKITPAQMDALSKHLGPAVVQDAALVPTPQGIRLGFMSEADAKKAVKALNGKVTLAGVFNGSAMSNDWRIHRVGQSYFDPIRLIGTEKFDATAPPIAQALREIDRDFAKATNGRFTLSPVVDELRGAIANEGWPGLERLAKKYAIPVVLLTAGLAALQQAGPPGGRGPTAG